MSDAASLELSRELYELSDWQTKEWWQHIDGNERWLPKYGLGYLLRKLPIYLDLGKPTVRDLHIAASADCWIADYKYRMPHRQQEWMHMYDKAKLTEGNTPEDAAAKLCIQLFKQGVLQKETK